MAPSAYSPEGRKYKSHGTSVSDMIKQLRVEAQLAARRNAINSRRTGFGAAATNDDQWTQNTQDAAMLTLPDSRDEL